MKWRKFLIEVIWVFFLTVLTQVGGIIWIVHRLLQRLIFKKTRIYKRRITRWLAFSVLYAVSSFVIVPISAKKLGREPLPVFGNILKPASWFQVICNRHYLKASSMRVLIYSIRTPQYDETHGPVYYLDANFPFLDGFPLIPHLSHNDGKKLDLAFQYVNDDGKPTSPPTMLGYGFFEGPHDHEFDQNAACDNGFYNITALFGWMRLRSPKVDEQGTKKLMDALTPMSEKMFLEPHLKTRWGLSGNTKIRFQGCHSVRHDDHIHLQWR